MNVKMKTVIAEPRAVLSRGKRTRQLFLNEQGEPMGCNLDLVAACAWKGAKYRTMACDPLLQPELGFTRLVEGRGNGNRRGQRYFPRELVRAWLSVFAAERPAYIRSLIDRGDEDLTIYVFEKLLRAVELGRLPESLRPIYVELYAKFHQGPGR
jgi:hypothetical protein